MNKRTIALITFAALVVDVTSFRPQQSVAFVVRGGAEENGDVFKESSPEDPNNETVKSEGKQKEVVCVGDACEIRGGSERSDPVDEGFYDAYEEELDEDEELVLGEAEFADEEDEEEDDEEDYGMMEAGGIEEEEESNSEVEADDVDSEATEESEEQAELPETEVASSNDEEAIVEEETEEEEEDIEEEEEDIEEEEEGIEDEEEDIEDEEEEIEVELVEEFLAEDEEEEQGDAAEVEVTVSEEAQGTWEENTDAPPSPYEGDTVVQHATDDDSSAFVDREELADAYDDDETMVDANTAFRAGHTEEDDRASIDDVPAAEEPAANIQEFDQTEEVEAAQVEEEETVEEMNEVAEKSAAVRPAAVTKEVEKILLQDCGFQRSEIRGLKPQIANVMADKRLRRPIEGIPSSWYEAKKKGVMLASLGKVLTAVVPVALGALAVYGGLDVKNIFSGIIDDANSLIGSAKEPKKIQKSKSESTSQSNSAVPVEEEVEEDPVEEEPETDRRLTHAGSQDSDDGKLWLDRQIDAVGDRLNALLGK